MTKNRKMQIKIYSSREMFDLFNDQFIFTFLKFKTLKNGPIRYEFNTKKRWPFLSA